MLSNKRHRPEYLHLQYPLIKQHYKQTGPDYIMMSLYNDRLACTVYWYVESICVTCIRRPMREAIAGGRGGRGGRADVNAPQSSPRGRGSCGAEKLEMGKRMGGIKREKQD